MDFFETVSKRRSTRQFSKTKVPGEVIERALDAACLAPNSSNLQPWEFYWVQTPSIKQELVRACFSQSAARTADELVVAVARVDTWKRNRGMILQNMQSAGPVPKFASDYYNKVVSFFYFQDPFGILGILKWILITVAGFFRPVPRGPFFRFELFQVVSKTTALACENFMLAIAAQGFNSCPMEGFDEKRVKKLLGLGCKAQVVMVIGVGETDPGGYKVPQFRIPKSLVVRRI